VLLLVLPLVLLLALTLPPLPPPQGYIAVQAAMLEHMNDVLIVQNVEYMTTTVFRKAGLM